VSSAICRPVLLAVAASLALVSTSARAGGDQYRRWVADKTFTCTAGMGGVSVVLDNQNVEFNNLPADAQMSIHYVQDGVVTGADGPYPVEQTSGTKSYGSFLTTFPAYPLLFEFRLDTIVDGFVVYESTLVVSCAGDGAGVPVIENADIGLDPGLLTGSWTGKWSCKSLEDGVATRLANGSASLVVTQRGQILHAELDGASRFRGVATQGAVKPAKGLATLTECRTDPTRVVAPFDQVIGLRASVKGSKARLVGSGPFLSDDGNRRQVGTCKYSFTRTDTADPAVPDCN
jgi:hypothetical protein